MSRQQAKLTDGWLSILTWALCLCVETRTIAHTSLSCHLDSITDRTKLVARPGPDLSTDPAMSIFSSSCWVRTHQSGFECVPILRGSPFWWLLVRYCHWCLSLMVHCEVPFCQAAMTKLVGSSMNSLKAWRHFWEFVWKRKWLSRKGEYVCMHWFINEPMCTCLCVFVSTNT